MRDRSSLALANAEREGPDLTEAFRSDETTGFLSPCVLAMLVGESEPITLVVLELPPVLEPDPLQPGDENEQTKKE